MVLDFNSKPASHAYHTQAREDSKMLPLRMMMVMMIIIKPYGTELSPSRDQERRTHNGGERKFIQESPRDRFSPRPARIVVRYLDAHSVCPFSIVPGTPHSTPFLRWWRGVRSK